MSFSTAPPEMLDKILNRAGIPMPERIALRAVSPRFRDVLEDGMQQETSLSLHIIGSEKVYSKPDDLVIEVDRFTTKKCILFFGRLFPSVTDLSLYTSSFVALRNVPQLLAPYTGQLECLKLEGDGTRKSKVDITESLATSINSLTALTSLHLDVDNLGCKLLPSLTPTLARLEKFSYVDGKSRPQRGRRNSEPPISHNKLISGSLSPHCTHLRLGAAGDFDYQNSPFLAQLASNLTHLHLIECQVEHLPYVAQMHRLTSLTVHFIDKPNFNSALLQKFRSLTQLTELNLINVLYRKHLKFPASKEMILSSVKRLTVQFNMPQNCIVPVYEVVYNEAVDFAHFFQTLPSWFPGMSNFSLHFFERGMNLSSIGVDDIAKQGHLPYAVNLPKKKFTTKSSFW